MVKVVPNRYVPWGTPKNPEVVVRCRGVLAYTLWHASIPDVWVLWSIYRWMGACPHIRCSTPESYHQLLNQRHNLPPETTNLALENTAIRYACSMLSGRRASIWQYTLCSVNGRLMERQTPETYPPKKGIGAMHFCWYTLRYGLNNTTLKLQIPPWAPPLF